MFKKIEHYKINIHVMADIEIKTAAINSLIKELAPLGGEQLLDLSFLDDNKIFLFGKMLRIVTMYPIREKDIKEMLSPNSLSEKGWEGKIILTNHINANVASVLQKFNISYCDTVGNLLICLDNLKVISSHVRLKTDSKGSSNLNTMAALKVIFCLLQYKDAILWPMRKIADVADVSLGSVQRVVEILKKNAFIFITSNGKFLKNKRRLLEIWVDGFNSIILPKITIGHAIFRDPKLRDNWQSLDLNKDKVVWGGESAAQLLDGYLMAEEMTIFTSDDLRSTVKDLNLIPVGSSGYITILKKFWNDNIDDPEYKYNNVVPLLIVYAQLMGCMDSRCKDAAIHLLNYLGHEELSK